MLSATNQLGRSTKLHIPDYCVSVQGIFILTLQGYKALLQTEGGVQDSMGCPR